MSWDLINQGWSISNLCAEMAAKENLPANMTEAEREPRREGLMKRNVS